MTFFKYDVYRHLTKSLFEHSVTFWLDVTGVSNSVFRRKLYFTQLDKFYISGRDTPERETERERDRDRDIDRERERDRQRDREGDRDREKQTERDREGDRERERETKTERADQKR